MTMTAKFAGRCNACHLPIAAGDLINWDKVTRKARHATDAACAAAKAHAATMPAPVAVTADVASIAAFLAAARDRGLKFPKARFLAPGGGELRLHLAGPTSKFPGSVQVKIDDEWIGRVEPDGTVAGRTLRDRADVRAVLAVIATDPAAAAKSYGTLNGRCSFCNLPLSDDGSVEVGYGPICARHWGLPHKPRGSRAPAPSPEPADADTALFATEL